jgi:hypothetical protein
MSIRLQFVGDNNIASRAISWFSAGNFSHVDAILPDNSLLGARSNGGVRVRPSGYGAFARRVVFIIPATPTQEGVWIKFLMEQVGKPYDMRAIWGFIFGRNWRETDSWICSELQAAALEAAQITPALYLAANKITPVSLALAVSAKTGAVWR